MKHEIGRRAYVNTDEVKIFAKKKKKKQFSYTYTHVCQSNLIVFSSYFVSDHRPSQTRRRPPLYVASCYETRWTSRSQSEEVFAVSVVSSISLSHVRCKNLPHPRTAVRLTSGFAKTQNTTFCFKYYHQQLQFG